MSFTAKDHFADWYKSVDLELTPAKVDSRIDAINELLKEESIEFWLKIVHIHLGSSLVNDEDKNAFMKFFKDADTSFLLTDNENLIKTLASISLCFKLEEEDYHINNTISLAVINANFWGQYSPSDKVPTTEYAEKHYALACEDANEVEFDQTKLEKVKKKMQTTALSPDNTHNSVEILNTHIIGLLDVVNNFSESHRALKDEVNVFWWLFGGFSRTKEELYKDIQVEEAVLIAARELFDLTNTYFCFPASEEFLSKILQLARTKGKPPIEVSVIDSVNKLTPDLKKSILTEITVSSLTPCLMCISKSLDVSEGTDWSELAKTSLLGADITQKFDPVDIAFQVYKELFFAYQFNS